MLRTRIELDEYVRRKPTRGEPFGPTDGSGLGGDKVDMDDELAIALPLVLAAELALRKLGEDGSLGDDHDLEGEFWREDGSVGVRVAGAPVPDDERFEPDDDFVASEVDDLGVL